MISVYWYGLLTSRLSCAVFRQTQASIVNQNSNTTAVIGNGLVTNNNCVINIIQAVEEQVSGFARAYLYFVNTLYTGRHSEKSLPVR